MDMIHTESHFNFVKMHLLSHFSHHIHQFGNIPMYSTEFGELAYKEQIKDGWRRSNKNDVERQILHSYGRQHAIRMRLLNLNSLRRRGANLGDDVMGYLDKTTSTVSTPAPRERILKGRRDDVSDVLDFCKVLGVSLDRICLELIRYSRKNLPTECRLSEEPAILQLLPVELLMRLEIPVLAFQETDVYDIYRAQCTGTHRFRNQESRNDWGLGTGPKRGDVWCAEGSSPCKARGALSNQGLQPRHCAAVGRRSDVEPCELSPAL